MKKLIIVAIIALLIGGVVGYWLHTPAPLGSAAGTTFSTAKVAQVNITPATASATSSVALYNTDSSDRIITDGFAYCNTIGTSKTYLTGTGLAGWTLVMATSSSAATTGATTNYAVNMSLATSSTVSYFSTSTEGVLYGTSRIWPTGTYLIPLFNATNTAVCTVGVHYLGF